MRYLLFFIPYLLFSFQDQTAQKQCVLTGRTTNLFTGEPLRKVNVHLSQISTQRGAKPQSYGGLSDAQGYFRFEGVSAGVFSLRGDRPGFLMTNYGAKGPNQAGTTITLQPGQEMTDLNLGLLPQAVISGRVLDEDGDPVSGIQVQGMKQTWFRGKSRSMPMGSASTNDIGEYRLGPLFPGKYTVSAQPMGANMGDSEAPAIPGAPELHQVRTFFPESLTEDTAAQVVVAAGQTASGTEIHLQRIRTFHVRGKIAGVTGRPETERLQVNLMPREQSGMMFGMVGGQQVLKSDSSFDISGVAPGAYYFNVSSFKSGPISTVAHQPVDVSGSDINDLVVAMSPMGTLRGRISIEGDGPAKPEFHPQIFLTSEEAMMAAPMAKFAEDGTFSIENIGPGKYYPQISGAPNGAYLRSVRLGQQEILGKDLDFSNAGSGELEIVFRYGVAQLTGTIQMPQDANKPSAPDFMVVLVPGSLNADGSGMRLGQADQTGTFTMKNITPGRYLAYALQLVDTNQLQNPDVLKQLASRGVEVELKEKDNKQIQLTPVPADDLKRILEVQ
jgi:Carboxypeptidase regulatory-like domain